MTNVWKQIATFFGAGYLKPASGTWGTLAAVPLGLLLAYLGPFYHMGFLILLLPLSIVAAHLHEETLKSHDASEIVIDEVVGFLITMTWLPMTWQAWLAGFLLFRLLDIWKPFPIRLLDRKVQGGLGVVIDDVAAGMIGNIILQIVYTKTSWLGEQALVITQ